MDSDRWQGEVPSYLPMFCDGWKPPAFWLEEISVPASTSSTAHSHQPATRYWRNGTPELVNEVVSLLLFVARPKKLLFPETRLTLDFTPDPKNFMEFYAPAEIFRVQFPAASSSCIMSGSSFH